MLSVAQRGSLHQGWAGPLAVGIAVAGVPLAAGSMAGLGYSGHALKAAVLGSALLVGLHNWRWALYGLLLYLPFSGIPIIIAYPETAAAVLLKDLLFVLPAYAGFVAWTAARRKRISFASAPVGLLLLLGMLVCAQALNPELPNRLVGAVGTKVWLLYIPLYFLGYHLIRDRRDLHRLLTLMTAAAIVPAVVGIIEAALIYAGGAERVYELYGDAAAAVTQNFAQFAYADGGSLRRVPSTFSFVTQYYAFLATMVAVTYAWWRGCEHRSRGKGALVWSLMLVAIFLSGARVAFLLIPVLVLAMLLLDGRGPSLRLKRLVVPVAAFLGAVAVLGGSGRGILGHTLETARAEFGHIFVEGFQKAFSTTVTGLGTGIDTNASRYAFDDPAHFRGVGDTWYESWYVKALLELGVPGLLIVVLLLGTLLATALRHHRALRDPKLRAVSAALIAFLIWNVLSAVKGQYLDFDPVNVYFWLLAGVLARLPALDRAREPE